MANVNVPQNVSGGQHAGKCESSHGKRYLLCFLTFMRDDEYRVLCVPPYAWWGWPALLDKGCARVAHKVVSDQILPPAPSLLFPSRADLRIVALGHACLPSTAGSSGLRLLGTRITAPKCLPLPCCRSSNPVLQ